MVRLYSPPPPSPRVTVAKRYLDDAIAALQRAKLASNAVQLCDALRSAQNFIGAADKELRGE